jgi:PIN domain nuclease of toxin-antitoxin system
MDVMIDTHVFLWQINQPDLLSETAFEAIRDPFDRLIVAQCLADGLQLISADPMLALYGVTRIW